MKAAVEEYQRINGFLRSLTDKQFRSHPIYSTLSTADHLLIVLLSGWRVISIGEVHRSSGALEDESERGTLASQLWSVYFRQQGLRGIWVCVPRLGGWAPVALLCPLPPITLLLVRIEKMRA